MNAAPDLVIAGGGVIGWSVAWHAARLGLRVTVVDRPRPGRATFASAGGLWALGEAVGLGCGIILYKKALAESGGALDPAHRPGRVPRTFLDFALQSSGRFPALAGELRETTGLDIEFDRTSLLFLLYDEGDRAVAEALLSAGDPATLASIDRLTPEEAGRFMPGLTENLLGALRIRGDDQVNPYGLTHALAAGAQRRGARAMTEADVTGLRIDAGRVVGVRTTAGDIPCNVFVNAAGAWAPEIARMAGHELPVRPVRGQIVCTETLPPVLTACISTSDCYLLQKRHGEILIGSTTEEVGFDAGVTPAAMRTLTAGAVRAVPSLAQVSVKRIWSGFRPGTPDELPILGPVDGLDGYLNACGHFRTGIVTAPLTGEIVAALAAGTPAPLPPTPFLLSRFAAAGAPAAPELR